MLSVPSLEINVSTICLLLIFQQKGKEENNGPGTKIYACAGALVERHAHVLA
jgi:hypothetical protein